MNKSKQLQTAAMVATKPAWTPEQLERFLYGKRTRRAALIRMPLDQLIALHGTTDEQKRRYKLHGKVYAAMRFRCYSTKCPQYKDYGGRGIEVCQRWLDSCENFISDMGWRPTEDHQLDRIDNDGNYEPANCRWVTRSENMMNRRNTVAAYFTPQERAQIHADALVKSPAEVAKEWGITRSQVYYIRYENIRKSRGLKR